MKSRVLARAAGVVLAAVIAYALIGCSKKAGILRLIPNERPTVDLTSAPVDTRDTAFYAYQLDWSGNDPDGQVDHFIYAIDPGLTDTTWTSTTKNEDTFFFKSTNPIPIGKVGDPQHSIEPHTFVIKAVDNLGLVSVPQIRSFFSYTVAPTVNITNPVPNSLLYRQVTPSLRIDWTGTDVDGQFTQKPVKYKYKLFKNGNSEFDLATMLSASGPDSLRRYYAARNFAGWDSVGGDTTFVQYSGLTLNQQYVFVVVAFDEAGAYSPAFGITSNMLKLDVTFAATLGPAITAFNQSFLYTMISGGFTPNNQITWVNLELPSNQNSTFNWGASEISSSGAGAPIAWYRWRLNGDVFDETPRTNPDTDWYHWSDKSLTTTSCTIGPFTPGTNIFLYIEAMDVNGLLSLLTIVLHPVQPSFTSDLLVVDDTRFDGDQFVKNPDGSLGAPLIPSGVWPNRAELDTFLFAKGGYPWRKTQVPASAPIQPISPPGIFAGYPFDTLGTRLGLPIPSAGVPLSVLGRYTHLIWLVDHNSASVGIDDKKVIDTVRPISALGWENQPNHMNTLGSYLSSGGSVWLLGGAAGYLSTFAYNAGGGVVPGPGNDNAYGGATGSFVVFANDKGELVPGRLMYDGAHWQSEFINQKTVNGSSYSIIKSPSVPAQPWTTPGWNFSHDIHSPNYALLPSVLRTKSLARGDSLPPTRTVSSQFYGTPTFDVEYLSQANRIIEDFDPSQFIIREGSALDTLMDVKNGGGGLAQSGNEPVTMTYYHGTTSPEFIFSGFNIWNWTRSDDIALVDFVVNGIWGLPRAAVPRTPQSGLRPTAQTSKTTRPGATPAGAWSRVPRPRAAGR